MATRTWTTSRRETRKQVSTRCGWAKPKPPIITRPLHALATRARPLPIPPLDRPGRALATRSPPRQAAQCLMCEGAGSFSTVCPHQPIQPMVIPGLHARELGGGMEGGDEGGSQWDACPGTRREGGAGSWDVPDKSETLPWGRSWRSGRQTGQNTTNE